MKIRPFCFYRECAEVMGRVGLVGALVEVPAQGLFKFLYPKNFGGDFDGHAPADGVVLDAWRSHCALDFGNIF